MKKTKILIVEDEAIIAKDIQNTILQLDFEVTEIVTCVNDVFLSIRENKPDIIMMDIGLNDKIDGIEVVKEIYKSIYIPVVYLTGSYDDKTIQRAIQTNPVGYLLKPFNRYELKSAILLGIYKNKNVDIKNSIIDKEYKHLGFNYYYDFKEQQLYYQEKHIKLGKNEIKLLELMILSDGKEVSFKMIEYEIWQNNTITKDAIRILVHRLRAKLDGNFIHSVPYYGYRFEG